MYQFWAEDGFLGGNEIFMRNYLYFIDQSNEKLN